MVASNSISRVTTSLNITVLLPSPENLTVAIVTEPDRLPQCHPDHYSKRHVFCGVPVEFEAFLPINADLLFEWKFVENSAGATDGPITAVGVPCSHGQACTSSVQVGLFFVL